MANRKQLTLHFDENSQHIIDQIRNDAKSNFRSDEQQALFVLSSVIGRQERKTEVITEE